jgi:hypothetical protein
VETELRRGYSGTARRKGRQQTNRNYCHRATFLLYRVPVPTNGCFVDANPVLGWPERRAAFGKTDRRLWVAHCLPWTSAIRWSKLGVCFPAVNSRGRPALADPNLPVRFLRSCPMCGPTTCALGACEAVVRGRPDPVLSGPDDVLDDIAATDKHPRATALHERWLPPTVGLDAPKRSQSRQPHRQEMRSHTGGRLLATAAGRTTRETPLGDVLMDRRLRRHWRGRTLGPAPWRTLLAGSSTGLTARGRWISPRHGAFA